jgi:hypothetical protein
MNGFVLGLSGAPGVGKTTALQELMVILQSGEPLQPPVLVEDNEWAFSMDMRKLCAEKSGMAMNSPDFVRSFNRQGQLDYQAGCRKRAAQGFKVIMPGPFEDLTSLITVGDKQFPLFEKMYSDFGGLLKFFQLLLGPRNVEINSTNVMDEPGMLEIEKVIQERIASRAANGEAQILLDADKHEPDYYRKRLKKQLITSEQFPQVTRIWTYPDETPKQVATKLLAAFSLR